MKFLFFALLISSFLTKVTYGYHDRYAGYYPNLYYDHESGNPILEYAFTMMYADAAGTSCREIIKNDEKALINSMNVIFTMLGSVKLQGLDIKDVEAKFSLAYQYCIKNPDDVFASALMYAFKNSNLNWRNVFDNNISSSQTTTSNTNKNKINGSGSSTKVKTIPGGNVNLQRSNKGEIKITVID